MSESGGNLQALFLSAKQKQEQLTQLDPRSDIYKELQHAIMLELVQCRDLVTRTAMFSVNEDVDDISTQEIQYEPLAQLSASPLTFTDILQSNTYLQKCSCGRTTVIGGKRSSRLRDSMIVF